MARKERYEFWSEHFGPMVIAIAITVCVVAIVAGITYSVVEAPHKVIVPLQKIDAVEIDGVRFVNVDKVKARKVNTSK